MISEYLEYPEFNREGRPAGMQPTCEVWGTVMPPSQDTQKGNVRVRVSCMKENRDIFDNVPVLTNYGGADHGNFVLPEEGDTVKLSFIGGDLCNPMVTGSRYPDENAFSGQEAEENNLKKAYGTRSGSRIVFSGDRNQDKIEISGSGQLHIELNEEEKEVSLGDREKKNRIGVDVQNNRIRIDAEDTVLIQCGKSSLELKREGGIKISCESLELEARSICIKAGSTVKLKGQEITCDSSMGMKLSAGSRLKLSGKGPVKISGTTVQLN